MEVKLEDTKPKFTPRKITITLNSQLEVLVLKNLSAANVSVPDAVYGSKGYYSKIDQKGDKYDVLYDFLGQLHKQLG